MVVIKCVWHLLVRIVKNLEYYRKKKKKPLKLVHCHIFTFMMPFSLHLFVVLLGLWVLFFLVETQVFLANRSRRSFSPSTFHAPPKVSAETRDLPSSFRGVLHHTGRFRCFTGLAAVRNGHCCCCSRSVIITWCIITCCRIGNVWKHLLLVVSPCITPQDRNEGGYLERFGIKHEAGTDLLVFSAGKKCFLVESSLCFDTFDPERYSYNRLSALTCFYY